MKIYAGYECLKIRRKKIGVSERRPAGNELRKDMKEDKILTIIRFVFDGMRSVQHHQLLLFTDIRNHGIGYGIVQIILYTGNVLFPGEKLRIRVVREQHLQCLHPGNGQCLFFSSI